MSKRPRVRDRSTSLIDVNYSCRLAEVIVVHQSPLLQMGIAFPSKERILDPRTRDEIVALLGRLLLEAARGSESEGQTLKSIGQIDKMKRVLDNDADYVEPSDMLAELCEDNKALAVSLREAHALCEGASRLRNDEPHRGMARRNGAPDVVPLRNRRSSGLLGSLSEVEWCSTKTARRTPRLVVADLPSYRS